MSGDGILTAEFKFVEDRSSFSTKEHILW